MNTATVRAELEQELSWRKDEIVFLRNQLSNIPGDDDKQRYRRALLLMLYAHYEGFCKFALLAYVKSVNGAAVSCADATAAIVAGSWTEIFTAIESGDQKCKVFKQSLATEDEKLHRFWRRRQFIQEIDTFLKCTAKVPDAAIDTESNLWPIVLQKNLFRVGLDHNAFQSHHGSIMALLNRRNGIAHGAERNGITEIDYAEMEKSILAVLEDIMLLVTNALQKELYKQAKSA